jgi:hypothetical protein
MCGEMEKEEFLQTVIKSLESISELYRRPYKDRLYERIVCYEFYHQFRLSMNEETPFVLHGELDKGYRDVDMAPDFVFHIPGTDKDNLAVIQFKRANEAPFRIIDDLRKIRGFRSEPFNYQIGILVLFGKEESFVKIRDRLLESISTHMDKVVLVFYDVEEGKVVEVEFPE